MALAYAEINGYRVKVSPVTGKRQITFDHGYEEFRRAVNLQTDWVDFRVTGQMWSDFNPKYRVDDNGETIEVQVILAFDNDDSEQIAQELDFERPFLFLTETEARDITQNAFGTAVEGELAKTGTGRDARGRFVRLGF